MDALTLLDNLTSFPPLQDVARIDIERHDVLQVGRAVRLGDVGIYHAQDRDESGRPVDAWFVCHIYENEWHPIEERIPLTDSYRVWRFDDPRAAIVAAVGRYFENRIAEHMNSL